MGPSGAQLLVLANQKYCQKLWRYPFDHIPEIQHEEKLSGFFVWRAAEEEEIAYFSNWMMYSFQTASIFSIACITRVIFVSMPFSSQQCIWVMLYSRAVCLYTLHWEPKTKWFTNSGWSEYVQWQWLNHCEVLCHGMDVLLKRDFGRWHVETCCSRTHCDVHKLSPVISSKLPSRSTFSTGEKFSDRTWRPKSIPLSLKSAAPEPIMFLTKHKWCG